ncbi:hypothetical protein HPULCUR_004556 [Helicostylum pulchrum]|uniref:Choice-of-anchor A domain-containing protein n=1 Tax=Helicostylum pulchrum TaxID=562976 RepID=A0ABP9XWK0_9FUNG
MVDSALNWFREGGNNFKMEGKLHRRDDGANTCSNSQASQAFLTFTGIFFGDFITTDGQDISGPLAVRGNMSASTYTINANHDVDCSDVKNNLNGYGLVVGGNYNGGGNRVRGAIFLPAGTDTSTIQQLNSDCPIITDKGTGLLDFGQTYTNAVSASQKLSNFGPTILLSSSDKLTRISDKVGDFDVVTMNTCEFGCTFHSGQLSDPTKMLYGIGNWNGPQDMSWPMALIVNIPVTVGSTITIAGNQPSLGILPCSTLYNFYPSDLAGNYLSGKIYFNRNTGGQLGGLTLAPEADINDSDTGSFAGQLIANNYKWQNNGVEIHDYVAIGGRCTTFLGCLPIENNTDPVYPGEFVVTPPVPSSSSEDFSTVTDPISSGSSEYSSTDTGLYDLPSSDYSLSSSSLNTDQTVGGSSYVTVTVTVTVPSSSMTYQTITDIPSGTPSSTPPETYSTLTGENSSTSATDDTIFVVTKSIYLSSTSASSESQSNNQSVSDNQSVTSDSAVGTGRSVDNTMSASITVSFSIDVSPTIEESMYYTYGEYLHIHEDEWHDHQGYDGMTKKKNSKQWHHKQYYHDHSGEDDTYDDNKGDNDDIDDNKGDNDDIDDKDEYDDEDECDEDEEHSHSRHYHKGKGNK